MGRIISEGLASPDDPMFNGGVQTFSIRRPRPPAEAPKDTDDENPAADEPQEESHD